MAELKAVRLKRPVRIGGAEKKAGDVVAVGEIGLPLAEVWIERKIAERAGEQAAAEAAKEVRHG